MKFEIDIEKLIDNSMPLNQYFLCQMIYLQDSKSLNYYIEQFGTFVSKQDFDKLVENEYLGMHSITKGYVFSNFYITRKFINQFIEKEAKSKLVQDCVEDWIDLWFNLFPRGVKSGGYLVRSDKNGCLNKMKKFVKNNPLFTRDIILKATNDYIDYMRMKNYAYMSLAHYFINKDGMSILAGQCEALLERINTGKSINLDLNQYKVAESVEEEDTSFGSSMMDRL